MKEMKGLNENNFKEYIIYSNVTNIYISRINNMIIVSIIYSILYLYIRDGKYVEDR